MTERIICNENGGELREEIVRCRNCTYCDDRAAQEWDEYLAEQYGDPPCYCDSPQWDGPYLHRQVRPNGFCAWGERTKTEQEGL